MEGESGVTRRIVDELHSSDLVKRRVQVVLLEVLMKNFNLGISKEIKWKAKVLLVEVSLMNFNLRISKSENGRWKWCYSKYHS